MNSDKTKLLATISYGFIHNRQEDSQVVCIRSVVHLHTCIAMEQQDCEVGKNTPIAMEVASPIAKDAINDGTQIELRTKSVDHGAVVDVRDGEGHLVCLEHVSALGGFHGRVHNRVELQSLFVDLDGLEGPRDKHEICLQQLGMSVRHGTANKEYPMRIQQERREHDGARHA